MAFAVTLGRGVPNAINIGALTALGYSFTAWITVDGASCPIYGLRNSSSVRDATCWIPSDEGKKFSVNWNTRSRDRPLYAQLWIDGVFCATSWMLDARNFPHEHQPMGQSFSFATTSDYTRRDFVFSSIQVTDDDEYLHTLDSPPAFGTIRLELWEGDIQQVVQAPFRHSYGSEPVLDDKIIHERSKKAGVHHVKFGEEYVVPPPIMHVVTGTRKGDAPLATFTFNYRPFDILLAGGLVPRPAEPPQPRVTVKSEAVEQRIQDLGA